MKRLFVVALALLLPSLLQAQTKYIDDTLYLGFYQEADGSGSQFTSAPSGTKLTLIEERGAYSLVRTEKGTEGWVKSKYLVDAAPAIVRIKALENISDRADALAQEVDSLNEQNGNLRGEIESLQSHLENAKARLAENEARDGSKLASVNTVVSAPVDQQQIDKLNIATTEALQALEKFTKAAGAVATDQLPLESTPVSIDDSTEPANLLNVFSNGGDTTMAWDYIVAQLKAVNVIHYVLIAAAIVVGFLLGIFFLDRRIRSQHGGYRIW